MKYKLYVVAAVISLLVAIPLAAALNKQHNLIKVERSQKRQLELKIDSVEKQKRLEIDTKQRELQKQEEQNKQLQQENEKLKSDLQAKADLKRRTEEAKLAAQRQATQSASISAGGARYAGAGNCEAYRGLVSQYGWDVNTAMAIMRAESSCNPNAANTSDNHGVCMGSFGLFQISCHSGAVYDPAANVAIAWQKYQARGWQPWGVYTSGAYLKYL